MSKHVLILGAGLVSQPLIDYLFEKTDYTLTVADIIEENARKAIKDNPRGQAATLDVKDQARIQQLVVPADMVVSLLPYTLHGIVARVCLQVGRHMINASYVSEEIRALDGAAREKGLLFLCEMGLDPGIDHMSAMKIIDTARSKGGKVQEFVSVCGGLPAPDANDNPFGYKFSWSPKGVLMAGNNPARYIAGGGLKEIRAEQLFHSTTPMEIAGMQFEAYPNRDSTPYKEIYGFTEIDLLMRGTLRYAGWHDLILALKALNLLGDHSVAAGVHTFPELLASLNALDKADIQTEVAQKLGQAKDSKVMLALDWLELFNPLPFEVGETSILDILASTMAAKMSYKPGERDMVVLEHQFKIKYPDHSEQIQSTLVDYGHPQGASSMARTVSLPLAIAVRLILEGQIDLKGVQIPVNKSIYQPVLAELEKIGIRFHEVVSRDNT